MVLFRVCLGGPKAIAQPTSPWPLVPWSPGPPALEGRKEGRKEGEEEEGRKGSARKGREEGTEGTETPSENPTRVRRPRENPSMVGISLGLLGPPTGPPAFPTSGRVFAQVTKAPQGVF